MTRICVRGEWYESISSHALSEAEYERLLLQDATNLFPSYHLAEFKAPVEAEGNVVGKPDLALIARDFGEWWVVEVELGHHPFRQHVLPQVETFAAGRYELDHAQYLARRLGEDTLAPLEAMMRGSQPRVLVLVNEPRPEWIPELRRYNASLSVVEVLRTTRNRFAIRVNGDPLPEPRKSLSECVPDPAVPRMLRVLSPAALPQVEGGIYEVVLGDGLTRWQRVESGDRVYLVPLGTAPLVGRGLTLDLLDDGRLVFRALGRR